MKAKRITLLVAAFILLSCLTQCHNKNEKITGVWQLQVMEVNGTTLSGKSLGTWLWEFNESGGFLTDVAGMREKGQYTLQDDQLTLKHILSKDKPDQVYKIAKLDTAVLDLLSVEKGYNTTMHFIKRKVGDATGDKD
jgi:hypothetical protein